MGISKVGHVQIGCNGIYFPKMYNAFYIHNVCTSNIHNMCIYMYGEIKSERYVVYKVTGATQLMEACQLVSGPANFCYQETASPHILNGLVWLKQDTQFAVRFHICIQHALLDKT